MTIRNQFETGQSNTARELDYESSGFRTGAWINGKPLCAEELRPYHGTLLHAFAAAARYEQTRGVTMITRSADSGATVSYRALYEGACSVAAGLAARGVGPRDPVLLMVPTSFEFTTAFFGVQLLRAAPAPTAPPGALRADRTIARLAHIANHSRARVCVTTARLRELMTELGALAPQLEHIVTVEELSRHAPLDAELCAEPDDIAFIQYTSGSTGNPKGVVIDHAAAVANIHSMGQALELTRDDCSVCWCPLYHDMGLIAHLLLSIYWRIPLVMMSPLTFLARPRTLLQAIHDHRATYVAAPNFAFALCVKRVKEADREGLDLSSLRLALNGAEQVNLATARAFQAAYEPHGLPPTAMRPVYGLAEATVAATISTPGSEIVYEVVDRQALASGRAVPGTGDTAVTLVGVGGAIPGHQVAIVDDDGKSLFDGEVGNIVFAGPSLMDGYFLDELSTARTIRDGWLWTGDLGYMSRGHLFITGRAKDVIVVRGRNFYPEDLEMAIEGVVGVRPGGSVAFGVDDGADTAKLVVVAEIEHVDDEARLHIARTIAEVVLAASDLRVDDVVLADRGALPKTSSGKRQRARCKELYLGGHWS